MADRLRARTALAVLLILLTIAGIHAVGPAVGLDFPPRRIVITIGIVLEVVLAALLLALRWRPAAQGRTEPAENLDAKLRALLGRVLATGLILIPAAILFASVHRLHRSRPVPPLLLGRGRNHVKLQTGRAGQSHVDLMIVQEVLVALVIAAIIVLAVIIWRRRRSRLPRLDAPAGDVTGTPADLARAVESGRLALREFDDAAAAIIACYVAMEDSLAAAGAARGDAETPDELLARAATAGLVGGRPAGRLTELFYEARFSSHPMPMSQRDQAEQALAELAATLAAAAPDLAPETAAAGPAGQHDAAGRNDAADRPGR